MAPIRYLLRDYPISIDHLLQCSVKISRGFAHCGHIVEGNFLLQIRKNL